MEQYARPLKVYISYSHQNTSEKDELVRSLLQSSNQYEILSDEMLSAGDDWNAVLTRLRDEADVFLLLVSPAFLNSATIPSKEMPQIMSRGEAGTAYVIPVILEPCEWSKEPFAKFQAIPKFGKAISTFENKEDGYLQLIEALDSLHYLLLNKEAIDIIKKCEREKESFLDLSGCNLYNIPRDLLKMPWITKLDLKKNAIRKIENLENLTELEYLDLSNNEITTLENLDKLTKLIYLDLERNRL